MTANATNHPMPDHQWVFRASVANIVDGDTLDLTIDRGMHGWRIERVRLLGVNTPETRGVPDKMPGYKAQAYVADWVTVALVGIALGKGAAVSWPLVVETTKTDDFGRYLAMVWRVSDGACLNDDLLTSGHAVVYRG